VASGETGSEAGAIRAAEYGDAFARDPHVFLVGDLRRPALHPFWRDSRVEVVLCRYEPGDDGAPHWHADVTEYELVLEGRVGYVRSEDGETLWLSPGDLHTVPAGVCVQRLVATAARTLAVKVPARPADKVLCHDCVRRCERRLAPREAMPTAEAATA
jgi:mannose-6-phosphate isomerase-like protein (cupin superfamily)